MAQTNSCENKAYPQGLPEEKTYLLADGEEVILPDHFDLQRVEKFYLANVDLKGGLDEQKQTCRAVKKSNRQLALGSLESDLTKVQLRLADIKTEVILMTHTYTPGDLGRICRLPLEIKNWHAFLVKDSKFQKFQKQNPIFEP